MALTVSALADQTGLSPDTVRYYERVGLLPQPARSAAGYRLYDQTAIGRDTEAAIRCHHHLETSGRRSCD